MANKPSIEMLIIRNQMRWAGHLVRMDDARLPKQIFYGELKDGKRPQQKPKKRFKDTIKMNLKQMSIDVSQWEVSASDRAEWRKLIFNGCKDFECKRVQHSELKRALRKQDLSMLPVDEHKVHQCNKCNRVCLSKAGLVSHMRSHDENPVVQYYQTKDTSESEACCQLCGKICKTNSGLKRHMKIHKESGVSAVPLQKKSFNCPLCPMVCKSEAGLKSHFRKHKRMLSISNEDSISLMNAAQATTTTMSAQSNGSGNDYDYD